MRLLPILLLLVGCAQPSPLIPQPPAPPVVAAASPTGTPAPRAAQPAQAGSVREVGETDASCSLGWSLLEFLGAIVVAVLGAWGLGKLYRGRAGDDDKRA